MDERIEIKYIWPTSGADPTEVNSVTVNSGMVPRMGELVSIHVQLSKDEWCNKEGRVKDVCWNVQREASVTVFLGA